MGRRSRKVKAKHERLGTRISGYLHSTPVNVEGLRSLAKAGFETRDWRRKAWPALLGLSEADHDPDFPLSEADIPHHRYFDQINKDIDRSMCHFDINKHSSPRKLASDRAALHRVIHSMFVAHPNLHYFQGYHDICGVLLIVCNFDCKEAFRLIERVSLVHIRDSHRPDLDSVVMLLHMIFPLIEMADVDLHSFLAESGVQSFLALPWVLTWFAHNIERFEDVCRVFDFLICSHPLMCMYLGASLLLHFKQPLMQLPEFSAIHEFFQDFPTNLDLPTLFERSEELFERYPPASLLPQSKLPLDSPMRLPSNSSILEWKLPLVEATRRKIWRKGHPRKRFEFLVVPLVAGVIFALAQNGVL